MKRSHEKELYPNYYECGAGGSVLAGESSQTAARRELKEETGLIPYSLQLMDQERDDADHCHFDYYLAVVNLLFLIKAVKRMGMFGYRAQLSQHFWTVIWSLETNENGF